MPIGQNIVEQQYELENVPMNRLMSMAETPDGMFPQYLVLTELERRNKMKSAYDMQKASMEGDTTVAEDLIMSSSETPAGINALGTSSSLSNQSVDPAGGITQMMAGGGAVRRYKKGGDTLSDEEINYIASNSFGQMYSETGEHGLSQTYPEIYSSVFGDNGIQGLDYLEGLNKLEKLYRAFSNKDLSRADLNKIHRRTMEFVEKGEPAYFRQSRDLVQNIFDFDSNEEYLDDYITKYYPEYTGDREGITSLIKKDLDPDLYRNNPEEDDRVYNLLQSYRGEENLRADREYRENELPGLEKAAEEMLDKLELEFRGSEDETGEIVRVESMIPNLISRTDRTGYAIELIRSMYPNMGDHQIEEMLNNLPESRQKEVLDNLEKDFFLHGSPLVNPSTGKVDWLNEEGKFNKGGSVYSNPYFGDADPEEVRKLQEKMPGLSTEDAVAIILGIDTSDVTKGFAKGGIARFNQGRNIPYIGVSPIAGSPFIPDPYYMIGPDNLAGATEDIQKQNAIEARARADKIIADLEAQYGVGNIPLEEYRKVKNILEEADLYDEVIEKRNVEQYQKDLEEKEKADALGVRTEELIVPDSERKLIEQEKKDREDQAQAIMEMSSPDYLAEEMKRYAGILGLPSEEERTRDKTTAMLLGLGSGISNATNLGDIGKSFPGIFNAMQKIDKQETKDKMGILNLLATQQKTNTLSRKDQIKALNDYLTSRQKALEMPGTDAEARKQIEAEIKQIEAALSSMLGTKTVTNSILEAKKYVGG